ncbi:MAG: glycosyltransferase family 2 protein [Pseudomonadota bacterium]
MQYAFSSEDGSVFECALEFDSVHYANLNFLDFGRDDIPFHLSFRFRRQVMVHNRRVDGEWSGEEPVAVILEKSGNRLRIEFAESVATVIVNGTRVARIDLPELLNGTAQVLHWVGVTGGVEAVALAGRAHENRRGRGVLEMDEPFRLEGWGYDPASDAQDLAIVIQGAIDRLPSVVLPAPDIAREQLAPTTDIGVVGVIPGWVWTRVDAGTEQVSFQLTCNGRPCGHVLTLTRASVLDIIEAVCAKGQAAGPFELLSSIEHVRFARLGKELSPGAHALLAQVAKELKVEEFVRPPRTKNGIGSAGCDTAAPRIEGDDDEAAPSAPVPAPRQNPVVNRLKALAPKIGAVDPADMAEVLIDHDFGELSVSEQRGYLLSVTSGFCSVDRFGELFHIAQAADLATMPIGNGDWTTALALPYHYMNEDLPAILRSLDRIERTEGWVDLPALGWMVRRVVEDAPAFIRETAREDIIESFLRYAERLTGHWFGSLPSKDLMTTMVAILRALPTLTDDMRGWVTDRALWFYGLSPRFWELVDAAESAGDLTPEPAIEAGRVRFRAVRDALATADHAKAIAALPRHAHDAPRFRRELAAAAQADGLTPLEALGLGGVGAPLGAPETDDPLLRHLAFPTDMDPQPALAGVARRAVRRLNHSVPRAFRPEERLEISSDVRALYANPPSDPDALEASLNALFARFRRLASQRHEWLGVGLALSFVNGALVEGLSEMAEAAGTRALALAAMSAGADQRPALYTAPAVRMALFGLRQTHIRADADVGRRILDAFAPVLKHLPDPFAEDAANPNMLVPDTGTAAFHDMLVVVYSCVPNLEKRIPAVKSAWLDRLEELGIPYIIVVGAGDGRREGRVVHLDAPDSYEALPQKTVAMAAWALENTGYSHIFKVDDDCFLDAEQAICGLAYRMHAYYGRRLIRNGGETDRIWHHARGSKATACMEIDKSAEPSEYADGGSGYVLNRRAMQTLVEGSKTRRGAWLKLVSFMEDKLVGDTLALAGMRVQSTDYHVCILRRNHSKGLSVCRWENSFLPSEASPVQLVHLDSTDLQPLAHKAQSEAVLLPKRVWPTYDPVRLGWNNVNVELISPVAKLKDLNSAPFALLGCLRNEIDMLPMFLAHYRKLGVRAFLLADNCSDDGTLEYIAEQPDVVAFSADADYAVTQYGVAWQQALMANLRMDRWSLVADADEFLVLPTGAESLPALLGTPAFADADAARIFMLDLYPEGHLAEATLEAGDPFAELTQCDVEPFRDGWTTGPYGNDRTWTSALRHRLLDGSRRELFVAQKYALIRYRPWMRFSAGLHYAAETRMAGQELIFAHFKYHAAFHERAQIETKRGQHFNNAEEYRRYLALMAEGRDVLFEEGVSVPWREAAWVKEKLGA